MGKHHVLIVLSYTTSATTMELDETDGDGPPLLIEVDKRRDNDAAERLDVDVDDLNLVKVPITIVTGQVVLPGGGNDIPFLTIIKAISDLGRPH